MRHDTAVIIPIYNEEPIINKTISQVLKYYSLVICINDGSYDNSASEISKTKALLINHPINLGQGAAIQTGIDFALQFPNIRYFVTFDADGQHDIEDVRSMLTLLQNKQLDIVLGSRFLGNTRNMSISKKILLLIGIKFTNLFSMIRLTDTHNGLRVFNRIFAEKLCITMPGMAHASEIIDKIGRYKWRYSEAPVTIRYTDYSRAKGQSILNSVNIAIDLLLNKANK